MQMFFEEAGNYLHMWSLKFFVKNWDGSVISLIDSMNNRPEKSVVVKAYIDPTEKNG